MDKIEKYYIVQHDYPYQGEFTWIGDKDNLELWLKDGSLKNGEVIHEISGSFTVVEKKELELIKQK